MCVCTCTYVCTTVCVWKSENNLQKLFFFFHHIWAPTVPLRSSGLAANTFTSKLVPVFGRSWSKERCIFSQFLRCSATETFSVDVFYAWVLDSRKNS